MDDQAFESASSQILIWKDEEFDAELQSTDTGAPVDPSPFSPSLQTRNLGAIKKIPKIKVPATTQASQASPLERSSSEASCASQIADAAIQFKDDFNLNDILGEALNPSSVPPPPEQQQTDKDWEQIVERMSIMELLNTYFMNRRNIQLRREVNQFIEQFEVVACFSLMNYMKDGLISHDHKSADLQISSFMAGFSLGINHANQASIDKSIMTLDVLIKQTQHYLVDQRDAVETLYQNTDVLQQNIQKSIGEMNKFRDLPDKLSDVLESARSKYETPRANPPVRPTYSSKQPLQAPSKQPQIPDSVVVTIHGIPTKICQEAQGSERSVRMSNKFKSYFEERPHIISKLKILPWASLKSCDGKDISLLFPEK